MRAKEIAQRLSTRAREAGFVQNSEHLVGQVLRLLVALRPSGRYLSWEPAWGPGWSGS